MTTLVTDEPVAQQEIEFLLRVQSQGGASSETAARLRSSAASLVKDILVSKLNIDAGVDAPGLVHVRGVFDADRALVACRALQVAFEGFCLAAPQGAAVSVLLDAPGPVEGYLAGHGPSGVQRELLASARPFQVLVTPAFYDKLPHGPLFGQRSFARRSGGYEFLWASDQRLAELQSQHEPMATVVVPMSSPATGVNDINDQTFFMSAEDRLPDDVQTPQFGGLATGAGARTGSRGRGRGWITAGSSVAVLAGLGYLGVNYTAQGDQLWKQAVVSFQGPPPPQPAKPTPSASVESQAVLPSPPPAPVPAKPVKPTIQATTKPPYAHPVPCTIGKSLVPEYVNLGNSYLNKQDLAAAKRSFSQVLACDPGNATAREGLQRIKQAQAELGKSDTK